MKSASNLALCYVSDLEAEGQETQIITVAYEDTRLGGNVIIPCFRMLMFLTRIKLGLSQINILHNPQRQQS